MKIDWTNEQSTLQAGVHDFEVASADLRYGKDSGVEYFALTLKSLDDEITVFDNISFSEKARNIMRSKLSALGLKGVENVDCEDLVGRRIRAAVKPEEDNRGTMRYVVDISAKGSHAGYFEIIGARTAPKLAQKTIDSFDSDIPF